MSIVHLQAIGNIQAAPENAPADSADVVERMALLGYAGDFLSVDGPVKVTHEHIQNLVSNHNSALSKISRLAGGAVRLKDCPPVQLDHSTSARDTVGRLVGDLILGDYAADESGMKVPAVYGRLRILGKENVERVNDGRWTHLSLGADFERGKLVELTVTPFPAATHAAMLAAGKNRREVYCDYPDGKTKCSVEIDEATGKYHGFVDGKQIGDGFVSKETAVECIQKVAMDKIAPLPPELAHLSAAYLSEGGACKECMEQWMSREKDKGTPHDKSVAIAISECKDKCKTQPNKMEHGDMNITKLKAFLVGHKKMADKDADDRLVLLAKPEGAEDMKKLVAEIEAFDTARLTAARESITKLRTGFKESADKATLHASQGRILTRLSKLRAEGKVTPAEIKKMDLVKLAAKPANEIDLVLKTYDDREPVIIVGQHGSTKAADLSQLSDKQKEMAKLEAETRSNMSLLSQADKNKTKLSGDAGGRTEDQAQPPAVADSDKDKSREDHMAYFEKEYEEITKMMTEGRHGEAKERLKGYMTKHLAMGGGSGEYTETNAEETEKHLAALAENSAKMQAQFDEAIKLAADLAG